MSTPVRRFRCDLCGRLSMTESLAAWHEVICEAEAALAIEARSDATGTGAAEGESAAIAQGDPS